MRRVELDDAIRSRRTHKVFEPEPVPREVVEELLELARWAPNHFVTEPWRFRVLGPEAFERLVAAGEPNERSKLGRAPTLSSRARSSPATSTRTTRTCSRPHVAVYIVLLAAHARGLASYWRTPKLLETPEGRAAVGLEDDEEFVALIHLGDPVNAAGREAAQSRRRVRAVPG